MRPIRIYGEPKGQLRIDASYCDRNYSRARKSSTTRVRWRQIWTGRVAIRIKSLPGCLVRASTYRGSDRRRTLSPLARNLDVVVKEPLSLWKTTGCSNLYLRAINFTTDTECLSDALNFIWTLRVDDTQFRINIHVHVTRNFARSVARGNCSVIERVSGSSNRSLFFFSRDVITSDRYQRRVSRITVAL